MQDYKKPSSPSFNESSITSERAEPRQSTVNNRYHPKLQQIPNAERKPPLEALQRLRLDSLNAPQETSPSYFTESRDNLYTLDSPPSSSESEFSVFGFEAEDELPPQFAKSSVHSDGSWAHVPRSISFPGLTQYETVQLIKINRALISTIRNATAKLDPQLTRTAEIYRGGHPGVDDVGLMKTEIQQESLLDFLIKCKLCDGYGELSNCMFGAEPRNFYKLFAFPKNQEGLIPIILIRIHEASQEELGEALSLRNKAKHVHQRPPLTSRMHQNAPLTSPLFNILDKPAREKRKISLPKPQNWIEEQIASKLLEFTNFFSNVSNYSEEFQNQIRMKHEKSLAMASSEAKSAPLASYLEGKQTVEPHGHLPENKMHSTNTSRANSTDQIHHCKNGCTNCHCHDDTPQSQLGLDETKHEKVWVTYVVINTFQPTHPIFSARSLNTNSPTKRDEQIAESLLKPKSEVIIDALDRQTEIIAVDESFIPHGPCPVCICEYKPNERLRKLQCGHQYHTACIDNWILKYHNTCPVCRDVCAKSDKYISI